MGLSFITYRKISDEKNVFHYYINPNVVYFNSQPRCKLYRIDDVY